MNSDRDRIAYRPLVDSADRLLEDEQAYVTRISSILPHFPADVLGQWFFDHWMQIGDNSWLDYPSLRFQRVSWTLEQIPQQDFGHEELLTRRVAYFANLADLSPRHTRLLDYIRAHGTWPRPIVVLDTTTRLRERPAWLGRNRYHLIEGHNRVAGLRFLRQEVQLLEEHHIWLVTSSLTV